MEKEFDKKLFGLRLREIRKSKGLTQEEICDITGIDVSNYSKMETGKITPSLASLQRLITLAGFVPNELFEFNHIDSEENLDKMIEEIYKGFSFSQKQFLYKVMRNLQEYRKLF